MNQHTTTCTLFALILTYVLTDGWLQGGLTSRNRLYVPAREQPAINRDLHLLSPLLFVLLLTLATLWQGWQWLAIGLLLRLALFDVLLNLRKGDPLFSLGTSALSDRLLRRVGGSLASAVLWVGALAAAAFLVFR